MSRLAKKFIAIPQGVNVEVGKTSFTVEGPKGKVEENYIPTYVEIKVEDGKVFVNRKADGNKFRAFQGLYWSLMKNCIFGVSEGFKKTLQIQGIGYKCELKGNILVCNVGYSHPVEFPVPDGVTITLESPVLLTVSGYNKQLVGQVAANIRFIKPPEPYKGKGIRYSNEVVKLKAGKSSA
jgi:large subunit ribosomal protein L6